MLIEFLRLLSAVIFAAGATTSPVRPELPTVLSDAELGAEHFSSKMIDGNCVARLEKLESEYLAVRTKLKVFLKQGSTVDAGKMETLMDGIRPELLEKIQQCGPCTAHEVNSIDPIVYESRTEYWMVSDGSCLLNNRDQSRLQAYFEKAAASLLRLEEYQYRFGGFRNIIAFWEVIQNRDRKVGPIESDSLMAFVAVKTPLEGEAMGYVIQNQIEFPVSKKDSMKISFKSTQSRFYPIPETLVDQGINGEKQSYQVAPLPAVTGMWYLNNRGYLRYFTAADFPMRPLIEDLAKTLAKDILLETLVELKHRAEESQP